MNSDIFHSRLFDEKTFYRQFLHDLSSCNNEVIIESPFITTNRMKIFRSVFQDLLSRGIRIYVVTRRPEDHENESLKFQAQAEINHFERIGVQALLCVGSHHRKLAILDRSILWEGSLNILSQSYSREIMRRIENEVLAKQMFDFIQYERVI